MRYPVRRLAAIACASWLCLSLAGGGARADGFTRGTFTYKKMCAGCHTIGWGNAAAPEKGKVDLTGVTARYDGASLRKFLSEPARQKPGSRCTHTALPRDPVNDLVRFLEFHAHAAPGPQITPPRSTLRKANDPPVRSAPGGGK